MIIKKIHIAGFGKLVDYEKSFNDGLNTIKEDNGFGKSTIAMFITAMLYGLEGTMQFKAPEKPRVKFAPWSGGAFGGYMEFTDGKKSYRVERSFGKRASEDTFLLIDLNTGAPSSDYSADLGKELFGIDDDGFERTVFLSERNIFGKNENPTIAAKLSNITYADGDIGGFDKAIALLDKERKDLQKRGGAGEIRDIKDEIYRTEADIADAERARDYAREAEESIARLGSDINAVKAQREALAKRQTEQNERARREALGATYNKMIDALADDEARLNSLSDFFGENLPTDGEISGVRESISEIKRCENEIAHIRDELEHVDDGLFTKDVPTEKDALALRSLGKSLMGYEHKAENISPRPRSPFVNTPTRERISELAKGARTGVRKSYLTIALIGLVLASAWLLALVIEGPLPTVLGICGTAIALVGISLTIWSMIPKVNKNEVCKYVAECVGKYPIESRLKTPFENLEALLRMLESHEADMRIYDHWYENRMRELENIEPIKNELRALISRFAEPKEDLVMQSAELFSEYTGSMARKTRKKEQLQKDLCQCENHLASLREYVHTFMSRYTTDNDLTVDEIANKAAEYRLLAASLEKRRNDAKIFASENKLDVCATSISKGDVEPRESLSLKAEALDGELIEKERQRAALASELRAQQEKYEHIDEYRERLSELNDKVLRAEEKLETVKKTMEMLERAKEQLCARYLDRVRQGFDKYTSQMDSAGVFTVDTSFSVTKNDFGKSRPQEAYSRGTRDLYSLAIRLAITDAIFENDLPPVILDDPFTAFDDTHLKKAQDAVKALAKDRQIIYLTCTEARRI